VPVNDLGYVVRAAYGHAYGATRQCWSEGSEAMR